MKDYKDFDMKFTRHPVTGDVATRTGVRAVLQSVRNIVLGELDGWETLPDMGAGIYLLLGENASPTIKVDTENKITTALSIYEPRAEVETVVVYLGEDLHSMKIQITFYVINNPNPVVEDIWVKRSN